MPILKTTLISSAVALAVLGCTPPPSTTVVVHDRTYDVTPPATTVKAGIVTAELTEMRVTERIEKDSGRIETPAKLAAKMKLQNNSQDQTVRLISGEIVYVDTQGQPIALEEARTAAIRFTSPSSSQLDPGQDATQSIEVDFPAQALKGKKLREIRLDLVYAPGTYSRQTATIPVSIGDSQPLAAIK